MKALQEILFHASMFTEYNPDTDDAFRTIVALVRQAEDEITTTLDQEYWRGVNSGEGE